MRVATFSPSSKPNETVFYKSVKNLEKYGIEVEISPFALGERSLDDKSDFERIEDIKWVFSYSIAEVIIPTRGGYGLARVLEKLLDLPLSKGSSRTIFGFSDFTYLLNYLAALTNHRVFHGPMLVSNFSELEEVNLEYFLKASRREDYEVSWEGESKGEILFGRVFGGNLTCLCYIINTPFFPKVNDYLLFLEDWNEQEYRVDRMLHYLKVLGVFSSIKGVIVGYSDIGYDVYINFFKKINIPFSVGFPSGHGKVNLPIPFGLELKVDFQRNSVLVSFEK